MHERVFEKDGQRRVASSPRDAVDCRARGYREVLDEPTPGYVGETPKPDLSRAQPPRPRPDVPAGPSDERNHAPD
jgi:hypothetical protein